MRKNTLVLILSSLIFFILIPSISAQRFNPHLDWKEITTEHFQVIYQDSSRDVAVEAVSIAENILPEMEQFLRTTLGYQPVIVCIDNTDLPNGSADPLQGEIRIVISEPYDFSLGTRFRSWLRLVIAHELTHLLHTTIASEEIARWRELLGFVVLPGVMQPMWAWEGYAVYGEKKFGEGGRTDDTTYDMYLREIALRDGFLSPYLVGGYSFLDSWPGRLGCYVYGSSVCQYLADTYGEEKLQEISHIRGKSFAIYGFEKALKTSLGVGSQQLWERWKEEKKKEYQQQKFEIEKRPLTPITYLTNRGYYSRGVNISPDGKRMVYFLKHPYYLSGIRLLERDQKVETLVVKGTVIGKPSFSTDGSKLVYAKVTEELYSSWCDLYIYDFSRKKETKITRQARAFSPVFWGDRVLFLRRNTFPEGIFVLDPVSGREEKWYTFGRDFLPMDGVLNPEGTLLALSGWHHGFADIALLDLKDKTLHFVTSDRFADLSPSFSSDGRDLFFCSDRTSVYNLYAFQLTSGRLFQVSNVLLGLFEPVLNGNEIVCVGYHASGFDIGMIPLERTQWREVELNQKEIQPPPETEPPSITFSEKPYQPLKHLLPRYWLPLPLAFGFTTSARDPLGFHSYALSYQNLLDGTYRADFSYRGQFMDPTLDVWMMWDEKRNEQRFQIHFPVRVSEGENLTVSGGYEHLYRDDLYYTDYWEGYFITVEEVSSGGDDRWMKGDRWQLTYQNGHLAKIPVERVIFSWKKNFIRAGNSSHSWEVEMNLGMSTLPDDFVLGGRKTAWGIAGYPQEALTGNFAGQIHVEYNFPIQTINQPLLSRGLVKDISGKIYAEGGVVGRDTFPSESLFSLGAEVTLHSFIADEVPIDLTLGYAHPLKDKLNGEWYLTLGARFR